MMIRMHRILFSVAFSFILCAASSQSQTVPVQQGQLEGTSGIDPQVRVYKGIPFAAPPVGDLRWKAPAPPAAWTGTRKADQFSQTCMQAPYPSASIYYSEPAPMSEDCLYLNVWTAAKAASERRPVMVWVHGGALTRGSGSTPTYDGEAFAKKGVVLVTINYRLGVFGFFAHPELTKESARHASGNYGILDQVAALQWVRKNIEAFGGDPERVTIFGESAGSWSVNYLMATPLAKGLFQRVIGESGGAFGTMQKLADVEASGAKLGSLDELRSRPAADLLKTPGAFPPNVDGWMLPVDVQTIFAKGKQNDVPLLAGSNANEGTTLVPWPQTGKAADFEAEARRRFGNRADEVLKQYPAATDDEARAAHYALYRDVAFGWQMRTWARMQTKTGKSKAYLYRFTRVPPGPDSEKLGAYHAAEIAYVFQTLGPKRPWQDRDRELSDEMSSYWVNFAATGDPNGKGLPVWTPYRAGTDLALELGDATQPVRGLDKAALDLIDRLLAPAAPEVTQSLPGSKPYPDH